MTMTSAFIQTAVTGATCYGDGPFSRFSIDSRSVQEGGTFLALVGYKQDGHSFVKEAVDRGARALIIDQDKQSCLDHIDARVRKQLSVVVVPNTYTALYELAAAWRQQISYPIIGVTGSVGKTFTKEMLANMLRSAGWACFASHGNQNTHIGVALNILALTDEYDIAVFEVGIDKRGEMQSRVDMLQPTTGIITTVAHSHLAGIGSLHDIAAEKRQLFARFNSDNIGVINGDVDILSSIAYQHPVIRFGFKMTNQVQARKVQVTGNESRFLLKLYGRRYRVAMETGHTGYICNALACAATCCYLGVSDDDIVAGMHKPLYVPGRYYPQPLAHGSGVVIDDCYNANPASMKEAILAFERRESHGEKVAILGDMEDLGVNTPFWHRQVGRVLRKAPSINRVILVGQYMSWMHETVPYGVTVHTAADWHEAYECVRNISLHDDSALLVKASRSVGLDNLVNKITHV